MDHLKKIYHFLWIFMIALLGGCTGRAIQSYRSFYDDQLLYVQEGLSWKQAWMESMKTGVIMYAGILAVIGIALIFIRIKIKKKQ